jgi:hypothetical protein
MGNYTYPKTSRFLPLLKTQKRLFRNPVIVINIDYKKTYDRNKKSGLYPKNPCKIFTEAYNIFIGDGDITILKMKIKT